MFPDNIKLVIAGILLGSAYRTLADPTIDDELKAQVIEGAQKYLDSLPVEGQVIMRQSAVMAALPTAELIVVVGEKSLPTERLVAETFGFDHYSISIVRRIIQAIEICAQASDKEQYYGVIKASKHAVSIAKLPWAWGFVSWNWMFKPENRRPDHRDYFMLLVEGSGGKASASTTRPQPATPPRSSVKSEAIAAQPA